MTFKMGLELLMTCAAAMLLSRAVSARFYLACLTFTFISVLPLHIIFDKGVVNQMWGLFESKNFFAIRMMLTLFTCIYLISLKGTSRLLKSIGLVSIPLTLYAVYAANSAGVIIAILPGTAFMICVLLAARLEPKFRAVYLAMLVVSALILGALLALYFKQFFTFVLESQQKNAGLTGRDFLWLTAGQFIRENPFLGQGYSAFWQVGNIDAEALWRTFGVRSGAGFTFHDLYINIAVDMGFVGLGVCLIFLVATVFSVGAWVMAQPGPESAFFGAVLLIFLLRSYVEVEFPVQFGSMTFLLFSAWGLSRGVLAEHAQASPQERVTPVMRGRLIPNSPKPQ